MNERRVAVCVKCSQLTSVRGDGDGVYGVHFADVSDASPCEMSFTSVPKVYVPSPVEEVQDLHHSQDIVIVEALADYNKQQKKES